MSESALALTGTFDNPNDAKIVESAAITKQRDDLLKKYNKMPAVILTAEQLIEARDSFRLLRELESLVEDTASALKRPIDALGKKILRTKEEFLDKASKAKEQLQGRINNYQQRELDKAKETAAAAERERVKAAEVAAKAAQELEAARAMPSATPEDIEAAEDAALQAELAAELLPAVQAPQVRGVSGREMLDFRLKGSTENQQRESLHAFAQAYPHLVKIEPKRREILEELNSGSCFRSEFPEEQSLPPDWIPKPPGLEVYRKVATRIS